MVESHQNIPEALVLGKQGTGTPLQASGSLTLPNGLGGRMYGWDVASLYRIDGRHGSKHIDDLGVIDVYDACVSFSSPTCTRDVRSEDSSAIFVAISATAIQRAKPQT